MQSPFPYTEEELQVLDAIRPMYPKASDKVVKMVFKDLKRGYKPQTELELWRLPRQSLALFIPTLSVE